MLAYYRPHNHLVQIRTVILAVALLTQDFSSCTFKIKRSGIKKYQVKTGEKISALKKYPLFDKVFDTSQAYEFRARAKLSPSIHNSDDEFIHSGLSAE
jgi:hypothetical protein